MNQFFLRSHLLVLVLGFIGCGDEAQNRERFLLRIIEDGTALKKNAIEENKKLAKKSGNKLTQNIDLEGNLIGVNNTIENNLTGTGQESTTADIRKELFEGGLTKNEEFDSNKYYNTKNKKD